MIRTTLVVFAVAATPALAEETRQMDAHEHGVGVLNIALDGNQLMMEFHAPGADIVGFEYPPETDADKAMVEAAVAVLAKPLDLFGVPTAAGCEVTEAAAELEMEEAHEEEADHDHDHDHGHDEDHAEAASHTEFHAEYRLTCADPSALSGMTFAYFETFENAREVEVQIVTDAGAQAFEVTRDAPSLDLGGMF